MAESSSELSLDKAKSAIRLANVQQPELSVAKDLVDKPFDQLTTDDIGKLGKTSEWTVVLLHALAGRFWSSGEINSADLNDIFELGDDKADAKKTLQWKLRSMQVAVSSLQEAIWKATGNVDQTTHTLAQEFQQLIVNTQQQIDIIRQESTAVIDRIHAQTEHAISSQADMIAQMEYNPQSFKLKELKVDSNNPDRTQGIVDFISSAVDTDNNGRADISADSGARDWLMRKFNKNRDTGRQGAAFGEMQLYNILSNLPAQRLWELAKQFTGNDTLDANNGKEFNKKLQEKAMDLNNAAQLITGDSKAQGDLFVLLNGKQDIYLADLLKQHIANLTKQSTQPWFTQKLQSALEKVGIPTSGQSLLDQSKQFLLAQGASLVYDNAFLSASTKDVNIGSSTHEPLSLQLGKGEVNAQAGLWYGVDLKNLLSGNSPLAIGAKADFNLNDNISRIINDGKALQDAVLNMSLPINEADILPRFGANIDDIYYKQAKEAIAQFNKLNSINNIKRLAGLLGDLKVNQWVSDSVGWSTKWLTAGINFLSPNFLQLGLTFSKLSQTYETRANEVESQAARDTNQVDVSMYEKGSDGLLHRADGIRYRENADASRIYIFDGHIDFQAIGWWAGLTTKFDNGATLITVPAGKELKVRSTIDNQVNGKILHRIEIKLVDRRIDASAAQPVAANGPVDIVADTLDATSAKEIMEALFKSTSSLSTVEIRRKYADLQKRAQEALQSGSSEKIQGIMNDPQMRRLLWSLPTTNVAEQAHALESMLGGMSGDWRYRILRAAQAGGNVDMKKVREALYTVYKNENKYYSKSELLWMTDAQVKQVVSALKMGDIYKTLGESDKENTSYAKRMLWEVGISDTSFDSARTTYRQSAQYDKLNDESITTAGGIGYVINHQVLDGRKEPTFSGRQPVTADSLIRATPPVEFSGQVDRVKFVQSLSSLQMNTLKSGLEKALGKADMSMDDIKTALTTNSDVTPKFYYAEYPNCTNAMVIMKLSVKWKPVDLTADFNDGLTGTAATADVRNHETKVTTGANKEIKKKTPPPPETPNTTTTPKPGDGNVTVPVNEQVTPAPSVVAPTVDNVNVNGGMTSPPTPTPTPVIATSWKPRW